MGGHGIIRSALDNCRKSKIWRTRPGVCWAGAAKSHYEGHLRLSQISNIQKMG
jgi:hypothetical protein